jgi:hypothetical protein
MKLSRVLAYSVVWAGLLLLIYTHDAHAYLDPGSGSYILQLALAGLLGASLAVKIFWTRIKVFLSNLSSKGRSGKQNEGNGGG